MRQPKPLREGKIVKTIVDGECVVEFNDAYITYDPDEIKRIWDLFCQKMFEGLPKNTVKEQ